MTSRHDESVPCVTTWEKVWEMPDKALAEARADGERASRRWSVLRERLQSRFGGAGADCVEIGCGEGDVSYLLAENGYHTTLVDFSATALSRAQARFGAAGLQPRLVEMDLFKFADREAGRYDVVCSVGLAEHFRSENDRLAVISAHRRLLKTGGLAFISVPYAFCIPYRLWMSYLKLRGMWAYGYEGPFSKGEMRGLLSRAGFHRCEMYLTGFAASIDRLILGLLTRRKRGWRDGPMWMNSISGWVLNVIAECDGAPLIR